jgi:hypothetical protein
VGERDGSARSDTNQPRVIVVIVVVVVAVVIAAFAAVFLAGFVPANQVIGSGNAETRTESHTDFTKITASHAFDIDITQSSSYLVRITLDDNLFQHLQVFKTGDPLTIRLQLGFSYTPAPGRQLTIQAEITMPDLDEVQLSGATRADVDGFIVTHSFVAGISGASRLRGTYVTIGDVSFTVWGASTVELSGSGGDLTPTFSGASRLELRNFPVNNANVDLSGASQGTVNPDGRLDATASGASTILYLGNPTLGDITTSGGSTIAPTT